VCGSRPASVTSAAFPFRARADPAAERRARRQACRSRPQAARERLVVRGAGGVVRGCEELGSARACSYASPVPRDQRLSSENASGDDAEHALWTTGAHRPLPKPPASRVRRLFRRRRARPMYRRPGPDQRRRRSSQAGRRRNAGQAVSCGLRAVSAHRLREGARVRARQNALHRPLRSFSAREVRRTE
jgi:hypothetical protein